MIELLIADDEAHARRVLQISLERAGYAVRTAENGVDALRQFREKMPDALITDIQMPKMTGEALCQALLAEQPQLAIPILVLTSRTEQEHRDWVHSIPRGEFIEKPVSIKQLVRRLGELFSTPCAPEGAPAPKSPQ